MIIYGNEIQISGLNSITCAYKDAKYLGNNKYIIGYTTGDSGNEHFALQIFNIAGNKVSKSKKLYVGDRVKQATISIINMDDTHLIILYNDEEGHINGLPLVVNPDDTLSSGNSKFAASSVRNVERGDSVKLDDTHIVFNYGDYDYYGCTRVGVFTPPSSIRFSSLTGEYPKFNFTDTLNDIQTKRISPNKILNCYIGPDSKGLVGIANISGMTVTYQPSTQCNIENTDNINFDIINDKYFVVNIDESSYPDNFGRLLLGYINDDDTITIKDTCTYEDGVQNLANSKMICLGRNILTSYSLYKPTGMILEAKANLWNDSLTVNNYSRIDDSSYYNFDSINRKKFIASRQYSYIAFPAIYLNAFTRICHHFPGTKAVIKWPSKRYEYYNTGDDNEVSPVISIKQGQTFTTSTDFILTKLRLKMHNIKTEGDHTNWSCVISLYNTANGLPTGSYIFGTTVPYTVPLDTTKWVDLPLPNTRLDGNNMYAFHLYNTNSLGPRMRYDGSSPTYTNGTAYTSSFAGYTKYEDRDFMFEIWGKRV